MKRRVLTTALAALLAGVTAAAPAFAEPAARPAGPAQVLVSTDVELDDHWAIAHLALEPSLELVGVLTTHSPSHAWPSAQQAAKKLAPTLQAAGRGDLKVVAGLDGPFGWEQDLKPNVAVDAIFAAARGHTRERPLTVLLLGAATDVALALVVDPTLADRIEVVAMGFDAWPQGGDAWNVKNDPDAWKLLLQSRVPLVVADAAVGGRDLLLDRAKARALVGARGPLGAHLATLYERWVDGHAKTCQAVAGRPDAWPLWDEATVAWLLGRARAERYPRPVLGPKLSLKPAAPPRRGQAALPEVGWLVDVDGAATWTALGAALDRWAAGSR